jgi:hypothetical protein
MVNIIFTIVSIGGFGKGLNDVKTQNDSQMQILTIALTLSTVLDLLLLIIMNDSDLVGSLIDKIHSNTNLFVLYFVILIFQVIC